MTSIVKFLSSRPIAAAAVAALVAIPVALFSLQSGAAENAVKIPAVAVDEPVGSGPEVAIFAGGCFWGVQGVF